MSHKISITFIACATISLGPVFSLAEQDSRPADISPATMPRIGAVDERFQSYNIEMVEVTGGRFWKPYASKADAGQSAKEPSSNQPTGMDPSLYQYRQPIDLANARLRKMAAALGPVYLRVSGTWANTTWFQNSDAPASATPPTGFKGVLTRHQWKGVVDFSHAVNAEIVTSFAISPGTRDASGAWTSDQAQQFVAYNKSIGGNISAAEFMNEPNIAEIGGAPKSYDAAAYGRDIAAFRAFAKQALPGLIFLGPGSVGEGTLMPPSAMHLLTSVDLFTATGPVFDAVSYHSYGAVSSRCGAFGGPATTSADAALSDEWLSRPERIEEFYGAIRDRFEPGKPLWNTETAQTACGGDRWASTFLDSFRYLNQLGTLAKRGVQVNMHNTLAASDYGLLDETTYAPRPNYWAAFLWHKLMATTVLDAGPSTVPGLHLFAQCLRNHPGGVALLVINTDRDKSQSLEIPINSERYTLTAQTLQDNHVQLNGVELNLRGDDALPEIKGSPTHSGTISFAPASITFLEILKAHNGSCK
ncbi:MAG: hypothetical protein ABSG96_05220 [Terracidiphilus sp.]|jgi:hypothetical protein